ETRSRSVPALPQVGLAMLLPKPVIERTSSTHRSSSCSSLSAALRRCPDALALLTSARFRQDRFITRSPYERDGTARATTARAAGAHPGRDGRWPKRAGERGRRRSEGGRRAQAPVPGEGVAGCRWAREGVGLGLIPPGPSMCLHVRTERP